ncbi:spermidine/putrescine ABC transporter ATP-binding protein [Mycobacterium sp. NS-7484]|uniref:ABC transporter ATP-binding protein n=1 Tax=Mycobacterium sp. NS-7484 TaxID=1834161 RepID=UPI00096C29CF|nr:ABC transporter ATP-binding protein [Mycobacterium sp. NS-7484]OMC00489.1 spermidine/putrescine ABC transporter ATP-binding protein [Mycobacterium sp. NS-7484]
MTVALTCTDLTLIRRETTVLGSVNLTVSAGEWVSVVGPNGAGKTTLLHVIAGLVPAGNDARLTGTVRVAGLDPHAVRRRQIASEVALMPQRPVVPEGVTVTDLVTLGRTPHLPRFAAPSAADRHVVTGVIERLGLQDIAARAATELSGGELQRVVLARALAQQPSVLLLDEPTSALDVGHQQQVLELVDTLRAADGITVIAAMHDLTLAGQYADRMLMLAAGRVVADGTPTEVLTAQRIAEVYQARVDVLERNGRIAVLPVRDPVR